jgi:hypothetical protein
VIAFIIQVERGKYDEWNRYAIAWANTREQADLACARFSERSARWNAAYKALSDEFHAEQRKRALVDWGGGPSSPDALIRSHYLSDSYKAAAGELQNQLNALVTNARADMRDPAWLAEDASTYEVIEVEEWMPPP